MDENKINPTPMDDPEEQKIEEAEPCTEQEEAASDEAVTAVAEADETQEYADEDPATENDAEEDEFAEEPEFIPSIESAQPETAASANKKKGKGAIAILVVLVALLVATSAFLVSLVASKIGSSKIDFEEVALTVGDVDVTVGEYMYWYSYVDAYYYNYYSYYYSSISEDQIKADTLNQITFTTSLYAEAVKAGYTLNDEDIANIDESMRSYTEAAEAQSMTVDEYIAGNFGKGYTADILRTCLEKQAIAYKFYEESMATINDEYSGDGVVEKVENAYKANKMTYDLSDVAYFYFDATEENAETDANNLLNKITNDGMEFDAAVKEVTGDSEKASFDLAGYDYETLYTEFIADAADWIFETDADDNYVNGTGAATKVEADGKIYVLYINAAPHRNEAIPVTIDYIKVDVSTADTVKSADELDIEAKSKANSILAEFEATEKTAEAFSELIAGYNEGEDTLVGGDAFEYMIADGSYGETIEEWAFSADRQVGDYAVLKGENCYYVVYYREKAENSVWYDSVLTTLVQAAKSSWETELISAYEGAVVSNDEAIDNAVAFIKANMEAA